MQLQSLPPIALVLALALSGLAIRAAEIEAQVPVQLPAQAPADSPAQVQAQAPVACRLALVLALDISASVDEEEYELLRSGTAAALASPEVTAAIQALGGVYVSVFEWSGRYKQRPIATWTLLDGPGAIRGLAGAIATHPRSTSEYPTALGAALGHAATLLARGPKPCERRVIDVAGDGANNHGFGPRHAYRAFDFNEITVNGLVVVGSDARVIDYYRDEVIRGPASFLEIAAGYRDFEQAMKRKLLREIGAMSLATLEETE